MYKIVNGEKIERTKEEAEAREKYLAEQKQIEEKNAYKIARANEYGSLSTQIEFITENGLEAWQTKVSEIKAKYPKPE